MQYLKATPQNLEDIYNIVQESILNIYPQYYPKGAVEHFVNYHSRENILADIEAGRVYICADRGVFTGTVSVKDDLIYRVFVAPYHQGKGYGTFLMKNAEKEVFENFKTIKLHAALTAVDFYQKQGYYIAEFLKHIAPQEHWLCYMLMQKVIDKIHK